MKKPKIDSVWKTNLVVSGNRYQVMGLKPDSVVYMNTKTGKRGEMELKQFLGNFVEVEL